MPSTRLARALLLDVVCATCIAPSLCNAQQADRAAMRMVLGCWNVTASPFTGKGPTGAGVDPGQTTLPSIVKFDSLPGLLGAELRPKSRGHLIQGVTGYTIPMYRSGYYQFQQHDSLEILWYDASDDTRLTLGADRRPQSARTPESGDQLQLACGLSADYRAVRQPEDMVG